MEVYTIKNTEMSIKYGKYKDLVFGKQADSYGFKSAEKNLNCATKILLDSIKQKDDPEKKNNLLLVGKVQSGKTSNLEMLTALAFDNGFNLLIIYGGYDSTLLRQCATRFANTFETGKDDMPFLFDTNTSLDDFFDNNFFENAVDEGRPVILVCMKRPKALNDVNDCLSKLDKNIVKAFIIDDEGDQASLNTKKKDFNDGSSTYSSIRRMKAILNNPLYFAVTATPEANIFQPEISDLMPETVHLIRPANCYTGADSFHLNSDNNIFVIPEVDTESIENGQLIDSLKVAINYYIIASAIMRDRNINTSEMIIHVYREISGHANLVELVNSYIENIKDIEKNNLKEDVETLFFELKSIYNQKYFCQSILDEYPWDSNLEHLIRRVIKKGIKVIEQNSEGIRDENVLNAFSYKIFIGGDLLQRGLTFKHLVTTYFTRWAKKGNMDTNLQRARWFGYRDKYIDLCKVFLTENIKEEFCNLANIENDLWCQFELAEDNQMLLKDIVIDADDTSLNPTRGNVANYKKTKFNKMWINQRVLTFDLAQIRFNNKLVDNLIDGRKGFAPATYGRNDGKTSSYFKLYEVADFLRLINSSQFIFDQNPFGSKAAISNSLNDFDKICVQLMFGGELSDYRTRSFCENKISYLQQGADSVDYSKQKYRGDSFVIDSQDAPCVQIFSIVPKKEDGAEEAAAKQYMFSIHFPMKKTSFIKK